MPISMSPTARYVTQSSIYTSPFTGPLTDRKIAKYQKADYFSGGIVIRDMKTRARQSNIGKTKEQKQSKKDRLAKILRELL